MRLTGRVEQSKSKAAMAYAAQAALNFVMLPPNNTPLKLRYQITIFRQLASIIIRM